MFHYNNNKKYVKLHNIQIFQNIYSQLSKCSSARRSSTRLSLVGPTKVKAFKGKYNRRYFPALPIPGREARCYDVLNPQSRDIPVIIWSRFFH